MNHVHQAKEFWETVFMLEQWAKSDTNLDFFFLSQSFFFSLPSLPKLEKANKMDWQLRTNYVSGKPFLWWGHTQTLQVHPMKTQSGFGDVKHVYEFLSKTQVAGKSRCYSIKHWNFVLRETKVSYKPNSEFRMHSLPYVDHFPQKQICFTYQSKKQ